MVRQFHSQSRETSEAAVERWRNKTGARRDPPNQGRHQSTHKISLVSSNGSNRQMENQSVSSTGNNVNRGQRTLHLKQKGNAMEKTSGHQVDTIYKMGNLHNEKGATTPSTTASTKSSCSTIQNSLSGLTLKDSFSPQNKHNASLSICTSPPRLNGNTMASTCRGKQASLPARTSDSRNTVNVPTGRRPIALQIPPPPPPPALNASLPVKTDNKTTKTSSAQRQRTHKASQHLDEEREQTQARTRSGHSAASDRFQPTSTGLGKTNRIRLHVYDLIAHGTMMELPWGMQFPIGQFFNGVNSALHSLGTGAYHVGIEINGIEYAYGANQMQGMTGVFTCVPKRSPGYQYRTTIDLGDRALVREVKPSYDCPVKNAQYYVDGREVVREMAGEYLGCEYDLLRRNCVTFAHDAALRLGVKEDEVPEWFRNLCVAGAAVQDTANSTIVPLTSALAACDMDGISQLVTGAGLEMISGDESTSSQAIGGGTRQ